MAIFIDPKDVQFVDIQDLILLPRPVGNEELQVGKEKKISLSQIIDLYKGLGSSTVILNTNNPGKAEKVNAFLLDAMITGINTNEVVFVGSTENGQEHLDGQVKTRVWGLSLMTGNIDKATQKIVGTKELFSTSRVKTSGVDADYDTYKPTGVEVIYFGDSLQSNHPKSFITVDWSSLNLIPYYGGVIFENPLESLISFSKLVFKEPTLLVNIKDIDTSSKTTYTFTEAISLIPPSLVRRKGLIITYPISINEWVTKQFVRDVAYWLEEDGWYDITYAHITDIKIFDYNKVVEAKFVAYNKVVDEKFTAYTGGVLNPVVENLRKDISEAATLASDVGVALDEYRSETTEHLRQFSMAVEEINEGLEKRVINLGRSSSLWTGTQAQYDELPTEQKENSTNIFMIIE